MVVLCGAVVAATLTLSLLLLLLLMLLGPGHYLLAR
jgi:hypothetical protein